PTARRSKGSPRSSSPNSVTVPRASCVCSSTSSTRASTTSRGASPPTNDRRAPECDGVVKVKAPKTIHICTACGAEHAKWAGQCGTCGAWKTLVEAEAPRANPVRGVVTGTSAPAALGTVSATATPRIRTGMPEFDFVLGGGIVPGSLVLVGGEPGIGKSTLL